MAKNTKSLGVADGFFSQSETPAAAAPPPAPPTKTQGDEGKSRVGQGGTAKNVPAKPATSPPQASSTPAEAPPAQPLPRTPARPAGRPKAPDLMSGEAIQRVGVYLTEPQKKKLAVHAAQNGMDQSAVVRMLIDRYL